MISALDRLAAIRSDDDRDSDTGAWEALASLARQMAVDGAAREGPIREIFGLLGDRWSMLILLALGAGAWRHATLRRILCALSDEGAISQRVLTLKLRALERDGLVLRRASADIPPRVDYRLSARGDRLLVEARRLLDWIRAERAGIEEARRAFDARAEEL